MTPEPKPYLEYLDKETTIMGLLSAFSVALASFSIEKIVSAKDGFFHDLWRIGQDHVLSGAAAAIVAGFFFYLQRSHLAWYYGQIALAQVRGDKSPESVYDWLTWADGWDTWVRYQTAFIVLTFSFLSYAYGVAEALDQSAASLSHFWSLWLPIILVVLVAVVRWHVLGQCSQEEFPFRAYYKMLRKRKSAAA